MRGNPNDNLHLVTLPFCSGPDLNRLSEGIQVSDAKINCPQLSQSNLIKGRRAKECHAS